MKGSMCPHAYGVLCKRDSCDGCDYDRVAQRRLDELNAQLAKEQEKEG